MRKKFVFDIETYPNYFLICFMSIEDYSKRLYFEIKGGDNTLTDDEIEKLETFLNAVTIYGFNSSTFDLPLLEKLLCNVTAKHLNNVCNAIIADSLPYFRTKNMFDIPNYSYIDHVDIRASSKSRTSLKMHAARLHMPTVQDLPIRPGADLNDNEMKLTLDYCWNDCECTAKLVDHFKGELELREQLSKDLVISKDLLMSSNEPKVAETVMKSLLGLTWNDKPDPLDSGHIVRYKAPDYLEFTSERLNILKDMLESERFDINVSGYVQKPKNYDKVSITMGKTKHIVGLGGLHSKDKNLSYKSDEENTLYHSDVASYYPSIIINHGLYPKHIGKRFVEQYRKIVDRRLEAKRKGDKLVSNSLKIVINSIFGKLASKWSHFYSPENMLEITLTGQLALLMLIERLENHGINVISANTDGIISNVPNSKKVLFKTVLETWELDTNLVLESEEIRAYYAESVNNYIEVGMNHVTGKGQFTDVDVNKSPSGRIIYKAIEGYLINNIPVEETVRGCKDIQDFIFVRNVTGGGYFNDEFLGKAVRWVWVSSGGGQITYKERPVEYYQHKRFKTVWHYTLDEVDTKKHKVEDFYFKTDYRANKVGDANDSIPMMVLGDIPNNLDYERYIEVANKILEDLDVS